MFRIQLFLAGAVLFQRIRFLFLSEQQIYVQFFYFLGKEKNILKLGKNKFHAYILFVFILHRIKFWSGFL